MKQEAGMNHISVDRKICQLENQRKKNIATKKKVNIGYEYTYNIELTQLKENY